MLARNRVPTESSTTPVAPYGSFELGSDAQLSKSQDVDRGQAGLSASAGSPQVLGFAPRSLGMLACPTEGSGDEHPYDVLMLDRCLSDSLEHITLLSPPNAISWLGYGTGSRITEEELNGLLQANGQHNSLRQLRMW